MEDKILIQIKTTCPFPLMIYRTNVRYNEVRKASGIAYILLELIQKEAGSNEKLSDVLLKFGIPQDLHYIFGQEIVNLISTDILESSYSTNYFVNQNYFKQMMISDIALTAKGKTMFQEGAIPTGAEKVKVKDVFFSPVTRKFDVESKAAYTDFASSYLGIEFLDHIDIDISGMEDYLNANGTKIGLKAEERMVSFETEEPKKMQVRKEEGMTIIIRPDGVEFKFDTTDETAFFYKYYSSKNMTEGLLAKNKYKFVDAKKDIVFAPTVSISKLNNITNVYIPDDVQKQASRPCRFFLNKGRLGASGIDSAIKINENNSFALLNTMDDNAEFALLDKSTLKFYSALNVQMPCEKLGDIFEMQLLVERLADDDLFSKTVNSIYNMYFINPFTSEAGKVVLYTAEALNEQKYIEEYTNNQLKGIKSVDDKIGLLLQLNSAFKSNAGWKTFFKELGLQLIEDNCAEVRLDNMIYKNTVLSPLQNEIGMSDVDFIQYFAKSVLDEDSDLVYEALETAGFETNLILSVVNVVEKYMNAIVKDNNIKSDTGLANKFKTVSRNLWELNDMLGIEDCANYTLNEDYNVADFFNAYSTLSTAVKSIEKYSKYAEKEYLILKHYLEIYDPIHELLAIERTSSSHPDKITTKYIDDLIAKGKFKDAICDLLIKLQYDLRKLIESDEELQANELIDKAKDEKLIDRNECDSLHKLRKIRNGFQHPERNQIPFTKDDLVEWEKIVFKVGGSK